MGFGDGSKLSKKDLKRVNDTINFLHYLRPYPSIYFSVGELSSIFEYERQCRKGRVLSPAEIEELKDLKLKAVKRSKEEAVFRKSLDKLIKALGK